MAEAQMPLDLSVCDGLPEGLLDTTAPELAALLGGPTLIHLPGRNPDPLFLSVLLHGNEHTGFDAAQDVLRRNRGRELPRALSLFIGNVGAAAHDLRKLPDQIDFNRAWPGTRWPDSPEARLMAQVVDAMKPRRPFASADIHSNTGLNPHYACINRLEHGFFHFARLFSRTMVHFQRPLGVQSSAFAELCPAVTVECGRIDDRSGVAHAAEFIEAALRLSHIPDHPVPGHDIDLLRTLAIVRIPPEIGISFDGADADVRFSPDIDQLNFSELPKGTRLANTRPGKLVRLNLLPGREDEDVTGLLDYSDDQIRINEPVIPSMLSRDVNAVRMDCLCYFMGRIELPEA
jgi:hypothetical protein